MAIYKRGNVYWMDVYVGSDRRRVRKSTGCTDPVQARIVEQAAVAVNRGITAKQRALAIIENIVPEKENELEIMEARDFYRAAVIEDGVSITKEEFGKRVNAIGDFAMWAKDHTRVKWIREVTPECAREFGKAISATGVTMKTRNNKVGMLHAVWQLFIGRSKATDNPWLYGRGARNRDEETSGRALADEELKRILKVCREAGHEWEGVVIVGLYTGARMRDVELLQVENVDLERNLITIDPRKTRRYGVRTPIPMHPKVRKLMEAILGKRGGLSPNAYIFPYRASHPSKDHEHNGDIKFTEILRRADVRAGRGEKLSFHSLRHTFVSRLAEAGVAQDVRMKLAGHVRASTHEIYDHQIKPLAKAIETLR